VHGDPTGNLAVHAQHLVLMYSTLFQLNA